MSGGYRRRTQEILFDDGANDFGYHRPSRGRAVAIEISLFSLDPTVPPHHGKSTKRVPSSFDAVSPQSTQCCVHGPQLPAPSMARFHVSFGPSTFPPSNTRPKRSTEANPPDGRSHRRNPGPRPQLASHTSRNWK